MEIRQVVVTGQNQVELQLDHIDSASLRPSELLIETEATFISAGTELANYTGQEPRVFQPGQWCTYPWKSGYANVGNVLAVGDRVTRAQVGERVFTYGTHASRFVYDEVRLVVPVPDHIDAAILAASRMAAVALTPIIVSEIRENPWVAIFGLGTVGNLAGQSFTQRGCRVIGIDPIAERRQLAETCGIETTFGGSPDEVIEAVLDLTGGTGAQIAVDAVGHSTVIQQAMRSTARYGQLILLGTPRAPVNGNLTELLSDIHMRWITLRSALEWCIPMYPSVGQPTSQFSKHLMILDWLQRGKLQLEPLISHRIAPEQIRKAYEGLLHEPDRYIGVALLWK